VASRKIVHPPVVASWLNEEFCEPDKVFTQIQAGLLNAKSIGWLSPSTWRFASSDFLIFLALFSES
jgi:hypothetical protein